jgi:murein DD-endopeptidase MepM/ murein hydrolase activator NlpD
MSEQNKPTLKDKFKNFKGNRAAVVIVLLLIVAVTVIISVTVASNRAKKDKIEIDDTGKPTETQQKDPPLTNRPTDTQKPADTQKPPADTSASVDVTDKMPAFVLPVSGVLSQKHDPDMQVHSPTMNDLRVHLGIDIVTEAGAAVYSAADGTVSRIWEDTLMGNCIMIKHSGDCYTIYKNLSETLPEGITEGASVRSGQLIASVGDSAMVEIGEEPHLHFEMTVADLMVDPLEYFDDNALESLKIDASFE